MEYNVIGLMSGTSLDGVDIALCNFKFIGENWKFKILKAKTYEYNDAWKQKLTLASEISGFEFIKLHKTYGKYIGQLINNFLKATTIKVDLISSHGHTVFHLPKEQINFQIGDAAMIASETGINTVSDFRSLDIALQGQGAPLVPIGDKLLFNKYDFCLNLGGFANISFSNKNNERIAYDICPANMALNELANTKFLDFDKNGELGRKGKISEKLLKELNAIEYYKKTAPKSLGKEWYTAVFKSITDKHEIDFYDKIRTTYEHIAIQLAKSFNNKTAKTNRTVLITGGGALNSFLIEILKSKTNANIIIPKKEVVEYKEALIFAFLGILRFRNEINSLTSVTGAKQDNCSGIVHLVKLF